MSQEFKLDFVPAEKHRVYRTKLSMPYSREEIIEEMERENWVSPGSINPLGTDLWHATRYKVMHPIDENQKLLSLKNFLGSDELKAHAIDQMFTNLEELSWEYNYNRESMFNETNIHCEFTKDMPGFVNPLHTDFRKLVATGMIYLTDRDDPDLSTQFYDDMERSNPIRMTTDFGDGWWHANGNNTYHEGWNKTNQVRYVILLGLTMNVVPID